MQEGIRLLPGIEINGNENVHWIFIFDDKKVDLALPEDDDYIGINLDREIHKYFNYDESKDLIKQANTAQSVSHDVPTFVSLLNSLEIPFIAIPHLKKQAAGII